VRGHLLQSRSSRGHKAAMSGSSRRCEDGLIVPLRLRRATRPERVVDALAEHGSVTTWLVPLSAVRKSIPLQPRSV
jgi:hypothetical protein